MNLLSRGVKVCEEQDNPMELTEINKEMVVLKIWKRNQLFVQHSLSQGLKHPICHLNNLMNIRPFARISSQHRIDQIL
jgi:hypothetical protein